MYDFGIMCFAVRVSYMLCVWAAYEFGMLCLMSERKIRFADALYVFVRVVYGVRIIYVNVSMMLTCFEYECL